ncbi:MAG: Unknown protein [uncultured Thiotrichaceae bacterium]|uniref:SAM-dependent methyltransferase n=1 Tax=uncultured Thiotrichaceae bacterium TaxID=298394 RepID=A0A6S6SBP4_9GAMM|nr:MAG: Unknown protein [uncultured Thiotrichaceae bacterium]
MINLLEQELQTHDVVCRFCGQKTFTVIDLGRLPLANSLSTTCDAIAPKYPTSLQVCSACSTAQLAHCADKEKLYLDYLYVTPESDMLTQHYADIIHFLQTKNYLKTTHNILEIGSNIGHFLKFLAPNVQKILGFDPARNIANMARANGIPTICDFFDAKNAQHVAKQFGKQDIVFARHCFAHNEKPWLMLEGVTEVLQEGGLFIIENAYFPDTIEKREFDQIYHEHMYYYNVRAIDLITQKYGFELIDLLASDIHGGSMLYVVQLKGGKRSVQPIVKKHSEHEKNMHQPTFYASFTQTIEHNRHQLTSLLRKFKRQGKTVHAYGASAKSTTLLNYYNLHKRKIPYVVDSTPAKQGKHIPVTNNLIISEEDAAINVPDYYLLTIWNYQDEIIKKVRESGNQYSGFIIPHPQLKIIEGENTSRPQHSRIMPHRK